MSNVHISRVEVSPTQRERWALSDERSGMEDETNNPLPGISFDAANENYDTDPRETKKEAVIQAIISTTPVFADQIDGIAAARNWFRPEPDDSDYAAIKAYMKDEVDLATAVSTLASPIDAVYTSANHGRAIRSAERTAAHQRTFYAPDEARERWGDPLAESDLPPLSEAAEHKSTTEGLLWNLWYSVLHVAKQTPYTTTGGHSKLLALVATLKARPDPPPPRAMTKALQNDWVWSSGKLWSELLLLGPSARESWNDCPGCGAGFSRPEAEAWANVNAFVARITGEGIADFWIYAVWALREALEVQGEAGSHVRASEAQGLDAAVPAAAVWVLVLGRGLYERKEGLEGSGAGFPGELFKERNAFCKERWAFWKERFGVVAQREDLRAETRDVARMAVLKMEEAEDDDKGGRL